MLTALAYSALDALGLPALLRTLRRSALVLCYHNIVADHGADDPGDTLGLHLLLSRFREQVEWLSSRYRVLPLTELLQRLRAGRPTESLAAITFDDGYTGTISNAWPVLRTLKLPATVFVVAGAEPTTGFWWDHPAALAAST